MNENIVTVKYDYKGALKFMAAFYAIYFAIFTLWIKWDKIVSFIKNLGHKEDDSEI